MPLDASSHFPCHSFPQFKYLLSLFICLPFVLLSIFYAMPHFPFLESPVTQLMSQSLQPGPGSSPLGIKCSLLNNRLYHFALQLHTLQWLPNAFSKMLSVVYPMASLVAQMVKNLPAIQETLVQSLVWEDPLEKGMTTHSSIPAWRISWTEEPDDLQPMGSQRVRHN